MKGGSGQLLLIRQAGTAGPSICLDLELLGAATHNALLDLYAKCACGHLMFDFLEEEGGGELGRSLGAPPVYSYVAAPLAASKPRRPGTKQRKRDAKRRAAADIGELSHRERQLLEATQGVDLKNLPPHLRLFGLQRRNVGCFSGPGVLPGEQEVGHVEYKLRLLDPHPTRFQQLVTQLNWRLSEGCGECLYVLGVEDNGHPTGLVKEELEESVQVLHRMAAEVGATAEVLQTPEGNEGRLCAVMRVVCAGPPAPSYEALRVAVAGGVDTGKSTLVSVMSHGSGGIPLLDNGRGSGRTKVLQHKHEIECGRTSSISQHTVAYSAQGGVLNYAGSTSALTPAEVANSATRVVQLFDLGGHERFSKTALHGLTSLLPDYVLLCVSATAGVSWVTREHLAVAVALGIPLAVAITKADLATDADAAVAAVAAEIRLLLAAAVHHSGGAVPSPAALAPLVESEQQAAKLARSMHSSVVGVPGASLCVPLFAVSSVTGASLQLLHSFFFALQPMGGRAAGHGPPAVLMGSVMQGWQQAAEAGSIDAAGSSHLLAVNGADCPQTESQAQQAQQEAVQQEAAQQAATHFQIDGSFEVADVGCVYSGTVVSGCLGVGDELLLGPLDVDGRFRRVRVSSIHRLKADVSSASQGQHVTVAVQQVDEDGCSTSTAAAASASVLQQRPQQQGQQQSLPIEAYYSTSCLHAWMQRSGSGSMAAVAGDGSLANVASLAGADGGFGSWASMHGGPRTPAWDIGAGSSRQQEQQERGGKHPAFQGSLDVEKQSLSLLGCSPHLQLPASAGGSSGLARKPRKGAVLLHPSLQPRACMQFEAVLVLLGGHWPARGLLSGCYPPQDESDDPALPTAAAELAPLSGSTPNLGSQLRQGGVLASSADDVSGSSLGPRSGSFGRLQRSSSRRRGATAYTPVVHCGSIRQAAQVVSMRELPLQLPVTAAGGGGWGWGTPRSCGSTTSSADLAPGALGEYDVDECECEDQASEEPLSVLLGCNSLSEDVNSGSLGSATPKQQPVANSSGCGSSQQWQDCHHPDWRQLAGALAAAGVLLPQPALGDASPTVTSPTGCLPSGAASGSSGHVSGREGGEAAAPLPTVNSGSGCGSSSSRLAAALERHCSLHSSSSDIGCVVAVTLSFMHQPEWLLEGARLIVRDRTTGRTAGAGYVTALGLPAQQPASS